jgi:hypothetical protein
MRLNRIFDCKGAHNLKLNINMDMDEALSTFVNTLGLVTFTSIIIYHIIVANHKDAGM